MAAGLASSLVSGSALACAGSGTCTIVVGFYDRFDLGADAVLTRSATGQLSGRSREMTGARAMTCSSGACSVVGDDLPADSRSGFTELETHAIAYRVTGVRVRVVPVEQPV